MLKVGSALAHAKWHFHKGNKQLDLPLLSTATNLSHKWGLDIYVFFTTETLPLLLAVKAGVSANLSCATSLRGRKRNNITSVVHRCNLCNTSTIMSAKLTLPFHILLCSLLSHLSVVWLHISCWSPILIHCKSLSGFTVEAMIKWVDLQQEDLGSSHHDSRRMSV